jgi:hypothetical protein
MHSQPVSGDAGRRQAERKFRSRLYDPGHSAQEDSAFSAPLGVVSDPHEWTSLRRAMSFYAA